MAKYHFYVNLPSIKDSFRRVQIATFFSDRGAIHYILSMYPMENVDTIQVKDDLEKTEVWVRFAEKPEV